MHKYRFFTFTAVHRQGLLAFCRGIKTKNPDMPGFLDILGPDSLFHAEFVNTNGIIFCSRLENSRGKFRFVRTIGKMLCFKT